MGTFMERTEVLLDRVGYGDLGGRVVVDQPYAQDQHETLVYVHRGGGRARYLGEPLYAHYPRYMQRLADAALDGDLTQAMVRNMEDLSGEVYDNAPFEFGDLKASGHPIVYDDGVPVYDRPPAVGRLNHADLDAKQELRNLGFGHNSWENTEDR
jgi:hypothetical protein